MTEIGKTDQEIKALEDLARKNNVHIDVAFNPFLTEEQRMAILNKEAQDPEWD